MANINLGDFTVGITPRITQADIRAELRRAEGLAKTMPLRVPLRLDDASLRTEKRRLTAELQKGATLRLQLDSRAMQTELTKLRRDVKRLGVMELQIRNAAQAKTELNSIDTLLRNIQSRNQLRIRANADVLEAVYEKINTQVGQLRALLASIRSAGGGGGRGSGGRGGSNLSPDARQAISEIERLNNLWKRGEINAENYNSALTAMQARLQAAAQGATRGSTEFAQIDRALTRVSNSLRSIRTDSLQRVRADAAALRLAFDSATAGVNRNSAEFRNAATIYAQGAGQIEQRLRAMAQQANLLPRELAQVNRELARLAREQNTIAGNINHAGLSGNIVNAAGAFGAGAQAGLTSLGGGLGMVAMQGTMVASTMSQIYQAAGKTGLALGAVGVAAVGAAGALGSLGSVGLTEVKKLETATNILKANGAPNIELFEDKISSLKEQLGSVGDTFTKGDFALATADIVKAGQSADEALTLMTSSTKLAAAEQIDLTEASALLLKNLRQYGYEAKDAARVGDMLAMAGNAAAGSAYDLSVGLGIVGGTGKQAGLEMYDLLGMLVELDNKGMSAADVGANGLRAAIAALADPSKKARGILAELNVELEDSEGKARPAGDVLKDLGAKMRGMGIEADKTTGMLSGNGEALETVSGLMDNRAAAAVLNLTGDWEKWGREIKDSNGYLDTYANTMQEGVEPALVSLKTAWADAGAAFASSFAGPLATFLNETLTPFVKQLGKMFELLAGGTDAQIRASLEIAPNDSGTAMILKILGRGGFELGNLMANGGILGGMMDHEEAARLLVQHTGKGAGGNVARAALGAGNADPILAAAYSKRGDTLADNVAEWCARWVRDMLGDALPAARSAINHLFRDNPERWFDSKEKEWKTSPTARSAEKNFRAKGLTRQFKSTKDLEPGDTVFYVLNGQNHVGVYVGNGKVRGNNTVSFKATGNPVGDVDIRKLGVPNTYVRARDLQNYLASGGRVAVPVAQAANQNTVAEAAAAQAKSEKELFAKAQELFDHSVAAAASKSAKWIAQVDDKIDKFKADHRDIWDATVKANKSSGGGPRAKSDVDTLLEEQKRQLEILQKERLEGYLRNASDKRLAEIVEGGVTPETTLAKWEAARGEIQRRAEAAGQALKDTQRRAEQVAQATARAQEQMAGYTVSQARERAEVEQANLKRFEANQAEALRVAGDNTAERLRIIKEGADRELEIRTNLLNAQLVAGKRANDASLRQALDSIPKDAPDELRKQLTDAANKAWQAENSRLYTEFADGLLAASRDVAAGVEQATEANTQSLERQSKAVRDTVRAYEDLERSGREAAGTGRWDADAARDYQRRLEALGETAQEAGIASNELVASAREGAEELTKAITLENGKTTTLAEKLNESSKAVKDFGADAAEAAKSLWADGKWSQARAVIANTIHLLEEEPQTEASEAALEDLTALLEGFKAAAGQISPSLWDRLIPDEEAVAAIPTAAERKAGGKYGPVKESGPVEGRGAAERQHFDDGVRQIELDKEKAKWTKERTEALKDMTEADLNQRRAELMRSGTSRDLLELQILNTVETERATSQTDLLAQAKEQLAELNKEAIPQWETLARKLEEQAKLGGENAKELLKMAGALRAVGEASARKDRLGERINKWSEYTKQLVPLVSAAFEAIGGMSQEAAAQWGEDLNSMVNDLTNFAMALARGDYFAAAVQGLTTIFGWFNRNKRAAQEAARAAADYNNQFRFSRDGYGTRTVDTYTTGMWFWKTTHYTESIDEAKKQLALSLESGFAEGIREGFRTALEQNDFGAFQQTLKESVGESVLNGLIEAFMQKAILADIIGPAIQGYLDTGNAGLLETAIQGATAISEQLFHDLRGIRERLGLGSANAAGGPNQTGDLFGNAPSIQLGIPRIEVSMPPILTESLTAFGASVPVFDRASHRMLEAAELILSTRNAGGPPPLSRRGPLV